MLKELSQYPNKKMDLGEEMERTEIFKGSGQASVVPNPINVFLAFSETIREQKRSDNC